MSPATLAARVAERPVLAASILFVVLLGWYLFALNRVLRGTPEAVRRLSPRRWTNEELLQTYNRMESKPITEDSYASQLPPRLDRRYIVTGGSGLVGGHIVLQLLARGQPPESIRIVDFQTPNRPDMLSGKAAKVGYIKADVSSAESTEAAFAAPWPKSAASLPLTVFHTAAVIVVSERSPLTYSFCEAVNVRGTANVVTSAKRAGADVLVSTTSGSISITPVKAWVSPLRLLFGIGKEGRWPRGFWQVLDERDFFAPLRRREDFYANYPFSKAVAERIVTDANSEAMRTGCIRPANGIYGNQTDNTVAGPLDRGVTPTWTTHIVQSFVHAINTSLAHLQFEAILAKPCSASLPQAGRPFTITDPNPPIAFADLYSAVSTLAVTPSQFIILQPLVMLLLAYAVEAYALLLARSGTARALLPPVPGELKALQPAIFSITTHLVASNGDASKPVKEGGLGYKGVITTLEGMVQEVLEWNHEHAEWVVNAGKNGTAKKKYISSVSLAEEIRKLGEAAADVKA